MSDDKPKVVWVDGRAVWETVEVVKSVTHTEIEDESLASVNDILDTVKYCLERGLPFLLRTPGTPVRGEAFDRYRMKVYAQQTKDLEAFTQKGIANQAVSKLVGVPDPAMTIQKAISPDYRASEISSLAELVRVSRKDDEEAEQAIRSELRAVEGNLQGRG